MSNILHIEQSSFFEKLLENIVLEKGYIYTNVKDVFKAREVLELKDIDLIITSLYSNNGEVEEFLKFVNRKYDIPVFVVTSDDVDDNRRDIINLGINEYILKKDLEVEIKKYLDTVFRTDEYMKNLQEANIAIVEDNDMYTKISKEILEKYNILNVDYYKDGQSILDSGKTYDLYLIDIILKNEFGKDLIRKIRRNNIDSSIIAVTALDNNKALANILDSGADDFITKPIDEELYIAKLKSNIRIYNMQKKINKLEKINS